MDIIFLSELKAETIIGIYEWERDIRQLVSVDLEMAADISEAAATDNIHNTVNYKSISHRLVDFMENSRFELIETLAENIASIVIDEYSVPWVRVTLHKPGAISASKDVGVKIERGSKALP